MLSAADIDKRLKGDITLKTKEQVVCFYRKMLLWNH